MLQRATLYPGLLSGLNERRRSQDFRLSHEASETGLQAEHALGKNEQKKAAPKGGCVGKARSRYTLGKCLC